MSFAVLEAFACVQHAPVVEHEHALPLIRVTSNAPEVFDGRISWPRGYGANFGSLALVLGPRFETVLFGASQLPEEPRAHGSRHDLDPLWSSEATAIRVDGAELGKLGRAAVVGSSKTALAHLMVCWKSDQPGNCGRCEKCLRTMTCLQVAGALERTDRFDRPLNLDAISRCTPIRHGAPLIRELVERLPAEESELRAAWAAKLREVEAGLRAERRRKAVARLSRRARRAPHRTRRALRRARRAPRRLARLTPRRLRRRFTG